MQDEAPGGPATPLAILFADISGSSLMYVVRGDAAAVNLATACMDVMDQQVKRHAGEVIKRLGDAILAVFQTPAAAVNAAAAIQQTLDEPESTLRSEGIHVRVGITYGPTVLAGGDVYGDVVNVASRILTHAGPDEIFLSGPAYEQLPAAARAATQKIDEAVLRGRPDWVEIYEYLWKQEDATVMSAAPRRATSGVLNVVYGPLTFVVSSERPKLKIGRVSDNDIAIDAELVSRYHAEISLRGDKFVLSDSSTNGTYVQNEAGNVVRVSREDVTLAGRGYIFVASREGEPIGYEISLKK